MSVFIIKYVMYGPRQLLNIETEIEFELLKDAFWLDKTLISFLALGWSSHSIHNENEMLFREFLEKNSEILNTRREN